MHLPVSGVIVVFELTRADRLMLHVVLANFIAMNVTARLPHGGHSFVHLQLEHDQAWLKMNRKDFIETDEQEEVAEMQVGHGKLKQFSTMRFIFLRKPREEILLRGMAPRGVEIE